MRRVHSTNTTPERKVRSLLYRLGFRFRLHRKGLPGKPDIVLPKYSTVIFVHGCFWHRHKGCPQASTPATRQGYWLPKFRKTVERDRSNREELRRIGWNVIVVWECELRDPELLAKRLKKAINAFKFFEPHDLKNIQMVAEEQSPYNAFKAYDDKRS